MNKTRNVREGGADGIVMEPLSARSLILSVLLGSHPPRLPASALVAFGGLFDVSPGTVRTALSRMSASGEVVADDGRYQLAGRLLDRQRSQDEGRVAPPHEWDGTWWTAIAEADRRPMSERRRFRSLMTDHRFGELRPDIWLRPANLPGPRDETGLLVTRGPLNVGDPTALVDRIWDLAGLEKNAATLIDRLGTTRPGLEEGAPDELANCFLLSASVVHHLRTEPQLPPALTGPRDATARLRTCYDEYEVAFQSALATFFRSRPESNR